MKRTQNNHINNCKLIRKCRQSPMSFDPFENLPDSLKDVLKEMVKRLENIDPEELSKMMEGILGPDALDKIQNLMQNNQNINFNFPLNPEAIKNLQDIFGDMTGFNSYNQSRTIPKEEEPYHEIIHLDADHGQIIIDLPGFTDVRQVNWTSGNLQLNIEARNEEIIYKTSISLTENMKLQDSFAEVKNGVFILPFKIETL